MKRCSVLVITLLIVSVSISGCFWDDDGEKEEKLPPEVIIARESQPGELAKDFLQSANYTSVVIEVDYISTLTPRPEAINLLIQRVQKYCSKSQVTYKLSDQIEASDGIHEVDEITDMEDLYRDYYPDLKNKSLALYVLYLDGELLGSPSTLGLTYRGSSFAIFQGGINAIEIPTLAALAGLGHVDFEKSVLVHELGHVLSLVNIGYQSDRDYEDPEHPHHSVHQGCVMYYGIETSAILNLISSGQIKPPSDFHADAQHDLQCLKEDVF